SGSRRAPVGDRIPEGQRRRLADHGDGWEARSLPSIAIPNACAYSLVIPSTTKAGGSSQHVVSRDAPVDNLLTAMAALPTTDRGVFDRTCPQQTKEQKRVS